MEIPKNYYIEKTGTTTLGIVCTDGIVIAADKRSTMGGMGIIADRKSDKIVPIVDDIVVTTAGVASASDRVARLARAELKLLEVRTDRKVTVKDAANLIVGMNYVNIRQLGEWEATHFLVAGKDMHGYHLYEAGADGTLKKHEHHAATGSGMLYVWPILETQYNEKTTVAEGIKIAVEAINQAQLRDTASGSGFDVYTITKDGTKKVITKDITPKVTI